ncbi:Uncharacterised protein [Mycobacteroides abscessus subsp. abscessus]|nr:Uncharacterised protein [Mycobacteroides abscessus subsp. abscessus]
MPHPVVVPGQPGAPAHPVLSVPPHPPTDGASVAVPGQAVDPMQDEVERYLAAVAHQMAMGRLQVGRNWIGPVWSLLGVGMAVATELNPIELAVCAAGVAEITPAAVTDFPCRVDEFAQSLRRRSAFVVKGGAFGVAALVSHRVHPEALRALKNRSLSYGSVIVPAVVDLAARRLHIPDNTPLIGFAVWGSVRSQARTYLPEPRLVLG